MEIEYHPVLLSNDLPGNSGAAEGGIAPAPPRSSVQDFQLKRL
jgi:hypothetical protein